MNALSRILLSCAAASVLMAADIRTAGAQDEFQPQLWNPNHPVCILSHVAPGETLVLPEPVTQPSIEDVYGAGVTEADVRRMAEEWRASGVRRARAASVLVGANVVFTITYDDGASEGFNHPTFGSARRSAFQNALTKWADLIQGPSTIDIKASFDPMGGGAVTFVIASAGPADFQRNFTNAPLTDTFYPEALTEIIEGSDRAGFDITCSFNSDIDENANVAVGVNFYYGSDANPPGNDIDFPTIVTHEVCHGLGFTSSFDSTGSWGMGFPSKSPTIFDRRLENGAGQLLVDLPVSANNVKTNNVFWGGLTGRWAWQTAAQGVDRLRIFAPGPNWNAGSSMSHWDENTTPQWYELQTPFYDVPHGLPDSVLIWTLGDLGYSLPDTRYAAFNAGSFRDGSRANPYLTVLGAAVTGINSVPVGGTVRVLTGTYAETFVISKAMQMRNYGGSAVIGAGAGPGPASATEVPTEEFEP